MKTKKIILSFILAAAVLTNVFAYGGIMSGEKKLKVTKTEWFDIIYPETSSVAAAILVEGADEVYKKVTALYGIEPSFRIVVSISPAVENMNAYWTFYPYNRIVLYDTGLIDDLDVFSETFLSTFRHELTHAVTYNLKGPMLKGFAKVFGDVCSLHFDMIHSGWAEGATVTSESYEGEGRLNNEYAKQMVKQAKIEGKFPDYSDVEGAADCYPYGSFYYFNGAFDHYLQTTYGMEKYAEFWYKAVNHKAFTAGTLFKKIYGLSINDAWQKFYEAYEVPSIPANPVAAGIAKDFFDPSKNDYSINNASGSLYTNLSAGGSKLAYLDSTCSTIYVSENGGKAKKLTFQRGVQSITLSGDGEYLAMDYLYLNSGAIKSKGKIYSFSKKQWFDIPGTGIQHGKVLSSKGEYYYVCDEVRGQVNTAVIYKLNFNDKGKITEAVEAARINLEVEEYPQRFVDLANDSDTFVWLKKSGLSYSICESDFNGNFVKEYKLPYERMVCRQLSYNDGKIYFSWTKPGTMPRIGYLDLENNQYCLKDEDISGGIYSPVILNNSSNGSKQELIWIGEFYKENRIFRSETYAQENTFVLAAEVTSEAAAPSGRTEALLVALKNKEAVPYSPFKYYKRGILLPFSQVDSATYGETSASYSLPFGVTYLTGNPWGDSQLQISAGYGYKTNSAGLEIKLSGGTDSSLFQYAADGSVEFDMKGWKLASGSVQLGSRIYTGPLGRITLIDYALASYGRANVIPNEEDAHGFGYAAPVDSTNYLYAYNRLSLNYANIVVSGSGLYEYKGFSLSAGLRNYYNGTIGQGSKTLGESSDLYCNLLVYVPHLLPIKNKNGLTYNLPLKVQLNAFNYSTDNSAWFGYDPFFPLASVDAEMILFGSEIQKAVPVFSVFYANGFYTSIGAKAGVYSNSEIEGTNWKFLNTPKYVNGVLNGELSTGYMFYTNFQMGFTPNIGQLANSNLRTNLYAQLWLYSGKTTVPGFSLGLKSDF